jgi:cytoskeletal protein RodZ
VRSRSLVAALAALLLGAGLGACGGERVSEDVPKTTPEITVSEEDLAGLSGGSDPTLEDRSTSTTSTTTSTTPSDTSSPPSSGSAAPSTATPDAGGATPAPAEPAPTTPDTGGATQDQGGATDEGDSGDTGGAGFEDFCQQNPGAC